MKLNTFLLIVSGYFIYFASDSDAVQREEEAIKLDGLNVAQMKEIREKVSLFICWFAFTDSEYNM